MTAAKVESEEREAATPQKRKTLQAIEDLQAIVKTLQKELSAIRGNPAQMQTQPPQEKRGFKSSSQHDAIFAEMVRDGSPGVITIAVAGAGKTSTLVEGTKRLRETRPLETMAFVAFNKSVAQTLRGKLPPEVSVNTIHSLCVRSVKTHRGWNDENRIQNGRVQDVAWRIAKGGGVDRNQVSDVARELNSLWSLAVSTLTNMADVSALQKMATDYGMDVEADSPAFNLVVDMDTHLRQDNSSISFDEILRVCIEEETPFTTVDTLLIDETQDLNRLQIEVLKRLAPKRVIAVGDPKQSIYAFRGSDHRAIDLLAQHFGITKRLPLSTTYRCSKAVVQEAQRLVRDIQPLPDAPIGEVVERDPGDLNATLSNLRPGDLVLSRNNAPLMAALLRGITTLGWSRACIIGGDGGKALLSHIERAEQVAGSSDPTVLTQTITQDGEGRVRRFEEQGQIAAANMLRDQTKTLILLLRSSKTVADVKSLLGRLTSAKMRSDAVNLSTIHRAKGLEADRVVLLGHNEMPNRQVLLSGNNALAAQEWNLLYVAITRARMTLIKQAIDQDDLI